MSGVSDLIARLRGFCPNPYSGREAADALEAQAAEIERLRAELAWVRDRMSGFCVGSWETSIAARVGRALDAPSEGLSHAVPNELRSARATAAEAERDALREALAALVDAPREYGDMLPSRLWDAARAALAETAPAGTEGGE